MKRSFNQVVTDQVEVREDESDRSGRRRSKRQRRKTNGIPQATKKSSEDNNYQDSSRVAEEREKEEEDEKEKEKEKEKENDQNLPIETMKNQQEVLEDETIEDLSICIDQPSKETEQDKQSDRQLSLIKKVIHHYDRVEFLDKDIRDTLQSMTFTISQDLSKALVDWEVRLKDQGGRQDNDPGQENFDFTKNSFSLWPLPLEQCPEPDWSIEEEISSITIQNLNERKRIYDEAIREVFNINDDVDEKQKVEDLNNNHEDDGEDGLSECSESNLAFKDFIEHIKELITRILIKIYESYPLQKEHDLERRKQLEKMLKVNNSQKATYQLLKVMDWKFIFKVIASSDCLQINESVLRRSKERMFEIFELSEEQLKSSALDLNRSETPTYEENHM
ncbi:expressed protein [Phakopsora pachyrhizi]|uniref:Expressed protein n=1 Tax=Phakopsora pachyrhizi TaxID=170000 RepID=A0AAV0BU11_PHAPC|nr:expressed protein [Phakopsora pachyrhizi]